MSLISPNFDVKSIIFPILARGLFPKLLEKALMLLSDDAFGCSFQRDGPVMFGLFTG